MCSSPATLYIEWQVLFLIQQNPIHFTPLHTAAQEGHEEVVKLLVEKYKVDVNAKSSVGACTYHAILYLMIYAYHRMALNQYTVPVWVVMSTF